MPAIRCDVLVGQFAVDAVNQRAHLAGVDEERLPAPVAEAAVLFVLGKEPEADGNLRRVEKLARQRDHAIHEVGFDDGLADLAFAGLVRRHAAVGQHEARQARSGRGDEMKCCTQAKLALPTGGMP